MIMGYKLATSTMQMIIYTTLIITSNVKPNTGISFCTNLYTSFERNLQQLIPLALVRFYLNHCNLYFVLIPEVIQVFIVNTS
jgi:hypothetical protein